MGLIGFRSRGRTFAGHLMLSASLLSGAATLAGCGSGGTASTVSTSGATTTTVTPSVTSAASGASVTLTATVSPSGATGTVTFYDGTTSLGTGTLSSGTASIATSSLSVGSHSITAVYGGNTSYTTSTSSAVTVTITSASTTVTTTALSASITTPTYGTAVTLTAMVAPAAATGSVTFYDGTTSLGAVTLSAGSAALSSSTLAVGTHSITATYAGSSTYASSTSSAVTVIVSASSTSTSCSSSTGTALIVCLANAYYATLSTTQQAATLYSYTLANAEIWSNLPGPSRNGLMFSALTTAQQTAELALVQAVMSTDGYTRFQNIRTADDYLNANGGGSAYGSGRYYIAFLGAPSTTTAWQLQVGGHHFALNTTYNGNYVSATPYFIGVEPKSFVSSGVTITALEKQRAAAYALSQTLTSNSSALLSGTFDDVVMGINGSTGHDTNFPQTYPTTGRGVLYSSLSTTQQAYIKTFIEAWVNDQNTTTASSLLSLYESDTALASTYVGYSGTGALTTQGDYIRVDGPRVWCEFVVQNGVVFSTQVHYHSLWRDKTADYGGDF